MGDRIFLPFPVGGFASSCVSSLFLLSDVVQLEGSGSVHPVRLSVAGLVAFILLVHPVIGLAHSLLHDASYLFGVMWSFRLNVEVTEQHSFLELELLLEDFLGLFLEAYILTIEDNSVSFHFYQHGCKVFIFCSFHVHEFLDGIEYALDVEVHSDDAVSDVLDQVVLFYCAVIVM